MKALDMRTELFAFWPGDGEVGFAFPVGVVDGEVEGLVALLGESRGRERSGRRVRPHCGLR